MRSALYNFMVVAIALVLFVPASRMLRRPPQGINANLKNIILDPATVERFRQLGRFKPGRLFEYFLINSCHLRPITNRSVGLNRSVRLNLRLLVDNRWAGSILLANEC